MTTHVYPQTEFAECRFKRMSGSSVSQTMDGRSFGREFATPGWRAELRTRPYMNNQGPDRIKLASWRGWHAINKSEPVILFDPAGAYPAAHPRGEGLDGWDGTGNFTLASAYSVSLSGLPAMNISAGDYISLFSNSGGVDKWSLHVFTESAAVSGSATLDIGPFVATDLFASGGYSLIRAPCWMTLEPDTFEISSNGGVSTVSIQAVSKSR